MVSLTQWTWVWVNSRSWWWTGRPSLLQIMGSQRVGHDWATELNWTDGFPSSHVWMWVLDHKEGWALKNWCFWTVVLEKTLESPLDCKEIQPVPPKDQSWVFIGRTDAEAEAPILWPPDVKNWLIWKDPDAGKDWRQEEKGMTEGEMVGCYHRLDGHESEWTPAVGDGQGDLAFCNSWGRKELDTTERLNWTQLNTLKPYVCFFIVFLSWGINPSLYFGW